jgi:hypothetical protein
MRVRFTIIAQRRLLIKPNSTGLTPKYKIAFSMLLPRYCSKPQILVMAATWQQLGKSAIKFCDGDGSLYWCAANDFGAINKKKNESWLVCALTSW